MDSDVEYPMAQFTSVILPYRSTQPAPFLRRVVVRDPGLSCLEFFNFVIDIGPVWRAEWMSSRPSVTFFPRKHADSCFDEFISKGYQAGIMAVSAPYVRRGSVTETNVGHCILIGGARHTEMGA